MITSQHEARLSAYTIMGYRGWGEVKQSYDHATAQHIGGAIQSVITHADISQSNALTRSDVPNNRLITRNMNICLNIMFHWLKEQGIGGLGTNKSGRSTKRKICACGGPLGYIDN